MVADCLNNIVIMQWLRAKNGLLSLKNIESLLFFMFMLLFNFFPKIIINIVLVILLYDTF